MMRVNDASVFKRSGSRRAIPVCAWLRHPTVPRPPRWRQMGPGTAYAVIHTNNTPTHENSLGPPPSCFTWNIEKRGCVFRRGGIYLNGWESGCCEPNVDAWRLQWSEYQPQDAWAFAEGRQHHCRRERSECPVVLGKLHFD